MSALPCESKPAGLVERHLSRVALLPAHSGELAQQENPKALEARRFRDPYNCFGCKPLER
jgi:hypothetical protein